MPTFLSFRLLRCNGLYLINYLFPPKSDITTLFSIKNLIMRNFVYAYRYSIHTLTHLNCIASGQLENERFPRVNTMHTHTHTKYIFAHINTQRNRRAPYNNNNVFKWRRPGRVYSTRASQQGTALWVVTDSVTSHQCCHTQKHENSPHDLVKNNKARQTKKLKFKKHKYVLIVNVCVLYQTRYLTYGTLELL